jgi:MFS family permease
MFDGMEMGLFPLVARPALSELLRSDPTAVVDEALLTSWLGIATAGFLIGAATGGVLFGWLGDRIGRVRAMMLSVLTYATFVGACAFVTSPAQIAILRFVAALGMGGEWALGVALVMELWPNRSRAFLAGLIGAAANVGYLLGASVNLAMNRSLPELKGFLESVGVSTEMATSLTGNSGWRLLMLLGALPALLTIFIQFCVPESDRWREERNRGTASNWSVRDLFVVVAGMLAAGGLVAVWVPRIELGWWLRIVLSLPLLVAVTVCYIFPAYQFLRRSSGTTSTETAPAVNYAPLKKMLLGACLSGVALLGTWTTIQWAPTWADSLVEKNNPDMEPAERKKLQSDARSQTQMASAIGAILSTIAGALLGGYLGRRVTYFILCLGSLATVYLFFLTNDHYSNYFLFTIFLAGGLTASFYGWLPLYLPELFPTRLRATGQGFSFNYGRILAAIGALQFGNLMLAFDKNYSMVCSVFALIYLLGLVLIWFAPETKGKELPE